MSADLQSATQMAALTIGAGLFGAILIALTFNTTSRESHVEALIFLILFWMLMPLLTAFPFWIMGNGNSYTSALFESVSAFTTTGASQLEASEQRPALLFWRSLLQWFGGVSSATFAVVILAALNLVGTGVHRSMLFTARKGELFTRLLGIGRLVASVYLFFVGIGFILMTLGGAAPFDAICLSLSGVSTGGLAPQDGPLSLYLSPFSAMVLAIICVVGAMNVAVIWDFLRSRRLRDLGRLFWNVEHRAIFVLAASFLIIGFLYLGPSYLFSLMLDALFFVSSTGFQYDIISLNMLPPVLLICAAMIGGSALSTAGGVKIIRMLLLTRHLGTELSRLSHPSRIVPVTFKSSTIEDRAFLSIWMYFLAYTICFGLGIIAFGASGLGLEDAIAVSAASLSNMGPLLPLTFPESGLTYSDFDTFQMLLSSFLMLLGRVEILAAIVLFTPAFWRSA